MCVGVCGGDNAWCGANGVGVGVGGAKGYLNQRPSQWHNKLLTISMLFCSLFFPFLSPCFSISFSFFFVFFFIKHFVLPSFGLTSMHGWLTHNHPQKTHQDAVTLTVDGIITRITICVSMFLVHRPCRNSSRELNCRPSSIIPATVLACCHFQWPSLFSFISSKCRATHTHTHIWIK